VENPLSPPTGILKFSKSDKITGEKGGKLLISLEKRPDFDYRASFFIFIIKNIL
jgi:hypothetical protein